jgi:hypothetical protein
MHHIFFNHSGFKKRAERFEAAQRERTIWRKIRAAFPVIATIAIAMGVRVAITMDQLSLFGRVESAAITALVIIAISLTLIVLAALIGQLNDFIKPPLPDGVKRRSFLVYGVFVPIFVLVTFILVCGLFVVMMQPHPWSFFMSSFS